MLGAALESDQGDPFGTVAAVESVRSGDEVRVVLVGAANASRVLVDLPEGAFFVAARDLVSREGTAFDAALVAHASAPARALRRVDEDVDRAAATTIARVACAYEILGACERMMDIAVAYACDRKQFDAPIGSFQALQHLLAAAASDLSALEHACRNVLDFLTFDDASAHEAALLKALAGRTGRGVLQATLQTLGGIGFTWEHEHHWFARRVLTLDALYGSVDELVPQLGADARRHGPARVRVFDVNTTFDQKGTP
jgi:hypothetical protein